MLIGVPKEIKTNENRVALVPAGAEALVAAGHEVVIETGAGLGSGFPDDGYTAVGATIAPAADAVWRDAEMIMKVKEPIAVEWPRMRKGQTIFTYFHFAADEKLTRAHIDSGATCIAYETVELPSRELPLLTPMSEVAGRMAVQEGAKYLEKLYGGRGVLLGGVPGVLPGKVLIIGGGTAGMNAAQVATGVGADVTILEVDVERMRFLDITMHTAHTLYSNPSALLEALPDIDLIIGAVLLPGAKAPKLITREMLHVMKPGTVFVDIAIDQGGCAETSRPTTHDHPTFVEEDVIHYCVTNMPGAYARTATQALTNVTFPYVQWLAEGGLSGACAKHPELKSGINVQGGRVTNQAVAAAHGILFVEAVI